MNCDDMMKIPQLQDVLKLKAGADGLMNTVRWIYFADCLQCIQSEYRIENYIHGGEFVILTNRNVTDDISRLMPLVEQMSDYGISALGINEGQISTELTDYCNSKKIPLFELPEKYPLIDLSQIMCQKLVLEENTRNSAEQLFSSILDAQHLGRDSVMAQARYLNINLDGSFCVAEFAYKPEKSKNTGDPLAIGQNIRRIIKSEISLHLEGEILILPQTGSVLALIPVDGLEEETVKKILGRITDRCMAEYGIQLYVGVGNSVDYLDDVRQSRNEASAAIKIAMISGTQQHILFFREQGIYTIISHVDDKRVLDNFVEGRIGRLIQADAIGNGNLCETLQNYLDNDCNAKKTAEAMFLHRNTLNYRLKKISDILGCDFASLNDCMQLKLAFVIHNYLLKLPI